MLPSCSPRSTDKDLRSRPSGSGPIHSVFCSTILSPQNGLSACLLEVVATCLAIRGVPNTPVCVCEMVLGDLVEPCPETLCHGNSSLCIKLEYGGFVTKVLKIYFRHTGAQR